MFSTQGYSLAPWIGPNSGKNCVSVLVLSLTNDVIENISEALLDVHAMGNFRWKLVVLRSVSIQDIVNESILTGQLSIDFVIIAVNTSILFCLDWASEMLQQVHPSLRIRRVVFVNATSSPIHGMAVNLSELMAFCADNGVEMLTADVSRKENANYLAQRLLKYIEVTIGVNTGIPNINI